MSGNDGERDGPRVARIGDVAHLPAALTDASIDCNRPVLAVVGGAEGMADDVVDDVVELLRTGVLPLLDRRGATVVDGGTDSGVMRVMGRARAAAGARLPLVGVAAEGTVGPVSLADTGERPMVEPHHTHVVLVPGRSWGDESPWLAAVATAIAGDQPSVTLVVNGGDIVWQDIEHSLRLHRPVVVLAGTGRAADEIAAAAAGRDGDHRAGGVAGHDLVSIVDIDDSAGLVDVLDRLLRGSEASD